MDPNIYGYVRNNPVNLIDPDGLLTQSYHDATGGGWKSPPPIYNPHANVFPKLTAGKRSALLKTGIGGTLIVGGAITGEVGGAAAIAMGIPIIADGATSIYIEWGLGGDTSEVPSWWWEYVYKIAKGIAESIRTDQGNLSNTASDCESAVSGRGAK